MLLILPHITIKAIESGKLTHTRTITFVYERSLHKSMYQTSRDRFLRRKR